MCGIAGIWSRTSQLTLEATVTSMANAIKHRGPDDSGAWADQAVGIALGHRRLSIVDLSAAGHQPMHSASERYIIVFNGEIYNHLDLRLELDAHLDGQDKRCWNGHSDTETLLVAFEFWGVQEIGRAHV